MKTDDIKGVIFDLDGTLVDSMWMWKAIDIEYLGKRNLDCPEAVSYTHLVHPYVAERMRMKLSK